MLKYTPRFSFNPNAAGLLTIQKQHLDKQGPDGIDRLPIYKVFIVSSLVSPNYCQQTSNYIGYIFRKNGKHPGELAYFFKYTCIKRNKPKYVGANIRLAMDYVAQYLCEEIIGFKAGPARTNGKSYLSLELEWPRECAA